MPRRYDYERYRATVARYVRRYGRGMSFAAYCRVEFRIRQRLAYGRRPSF